MKSQIKLLIIFIGALVLILGASFFMKKPAAPSETKKEETTQEQAKEQGREIAQNIIADYNTGFEGQGWWNNTDWNEDGLTYTPYKDGEAPSEACGANYLAVQNIAQFCHDQLATILVPTSVYEFTYYVRLADGVNAGDVALDVVSVSDDWSVQSPAEVTYDADVTLSNTWQKVSGTFTMPENDRHAQVLVRLTGTNGTSAAAFCVDEFVVGLLEAGEGGNVSSGSKAIQEDLTPLYSVMGAEDGLGAMAGVCVPAAALSDDARMALVGKHFNSVTCENEMKPESILGSSPRKTDANELGVELNFGAADAVADAILAYNAANGTDIKMRGHVLVWHSQTPEWFFHEEFDASKALVSKETMIERMDQYIKLVLEHFYAPDSKYKDLIYAWDVVNEAIDDGTNKVRKEQAWYQIFPEDDSFICQAFVSANKYAPENVKLFYNDYNDTKGGKVKGICSLITNIKATEGARIDGMGMQGHYDMGSPSVNELENAIRAYADLVDEIQVTELDIKSSMKYDGTDATKEEEYTNEGYRYKEIYDTFCRMKEELGINVSAMVFWGTDDGHSWLNSSNAVGGSADGVHKQCPLLFDADYQAKPAYWGIVDPSQLASNVKTVLSTTLPISEYTFEDSTVKFVPTWSASGLNVKVHVDDATDDDTDAVTLYVDFSNARDAQPNDAIEAVTISRSEATAVDGGYEAEFTIAKDGLKISDEVAFDVAVVNGTETISYNDKKNTQEKSSKYYAKMLLKPAMEIHKGTVSVGDTLDAAWEQVEEVPLEVITGSIEASATGKVLWDEENLYVLMNVKDPTIDLTAEADHEKDSVEIFIDENNGKTDALDGDDKQYRVNAENVQTFNGESCVESNITSKVITTDDGYVVVAAIKWTSLKPSADTCIGFDMQINDGKGGARLGTANWYDASGSGWSQSAAFGTAKLVE